MLIARFRQGYLYRPFWKGKVVKRRGTPVSALPHDRNTGQVRRPGGDQRTLC